MHNIFKNYPPFKPIANRKTTIAIPNNPTKLKTLNIPFPIIANIKESPNSPNKIFPPQKPFMENRLPLKNQKQQANIKNSIEPMLEYFLIIILHPL